MTRTRSRSSFAIVLLLTPAMLPLQARAEDADTDILSEARILHDAAIPAAGNADGDITIVEYFDYQCPYCRKISPDLAKV
ncbi:MAG: thioredoxin domain-containing protein, partial [Bradyrhizobium sp.]|nr:thioredoxin domain-containing protein [Bradyrhizobium sp.]